MKEIFRPLLPNITRRQLRAFAAVVEMGSISQAAQRLNVTPPAVSLQMRQLEAAAGLPLLDRAKAGMRPTEAGRIVLKAAGEIEAALSACAEEIAALSGVERGRVVVGVVSTAKYFAPRALAIFSREHPGVDVRLIVGNRGVVLSALRDFSIDFAVAGRPPEDMAIDRAVIGDNPHIIIGPPGHPLAGKRNVPLARFADETFLLREEGSGTRMLMERLFSEAGLSPNIGMEIGSNETIKQAVMAGLGIALISAHTVAAELEDGRLISFDVPGLPIVRQWFVTKRTERQLLPAAQALWDFFEKRSAEYLPDAAGQLAGEAGTRPALTPIPAT
jgi:LysR family transcriptional regulator for metE and metH